MHDNVNTGSFVIFEWDDDKAAANVRKHHVAFELAELVWDDPAHIIVFDRNENDEERWHAIGLVRGILILTVVHAHPMGGDENSIRIISARKATADERKRYEEQDD
jgi:uncharacterized DUF497 family protein